MAGETDDDRVSLLRSFRNQSASFLQWATATDSARTADFVIDSRDGEDLQRILEAEAELPQIADKARNLDSVIKAVADTVSHPEWTCPDKLYSGGDGCDCDCGVWDPDCDADSTFGYVIEDEGGKLRTLDTARMYELLSKYDTNYDNTFP